MKKFIHFLSIILFFAVFCTATVSAGQFSERYVKPVIKNFSPFDYKGHGQMWNIIQGKDGVIYFANTYTGVLLYDGRYWKRVSLKKSMTMRSLARDREGTVYAGGRGDFGYLKTSHGITEFISLRAHIPQEFRNFGNVWQVLVADQGVYFVTYRNIFRWFKNRIDVIETASQFYPAGKAFGKLYVLQKDTGLMRIEEASLIAVPDAVSFRNNNIIANVFIPFDKNSIMVVSRNKGCFIYNGKKLRPYHTEANRYLAENLVYTSALLSHGLFAFGTKRGGLVIIEKGGKIKSIINKKHGLRDNHILSMFVDSSGGLWLGLNNGISRVDFFPPLTSFNETSGYRGSVLSILRQNGKLYLATSLGLYKENLRVKIGRPFFRKVPGINGQVKKLIKGDGDLLAATLFGVYHISGGKINYRISRDTVYDMILSKKRPDILFTIVTGKGVSAIQKLAGRWIRRGRITGLEDNVKSVAEDEDNKIWITTEKNGIIRGTYSMIENRFMEEKRFPGNTIGAGIRISTVSKKLLFCTERGIFSFNEERNSFETEKKIGKFFTGKDIIEVIENPGGSLWVREGILFHIFAAERGEDGTYLMNSAPFFGLQRFRCYTVYNDREGLVWFGGPEGLVSYNRKHIPESFTAYPPLIRRADANGRPFFGESCKNPGFFENKNGNVDLDNSFNSLSFSFSIPFYYDESRNQYQVKLENHDTEWSAWSNSTEAFYHSLPEGSYSFLVRGKNINSEISETGRYNFTISPPWYKRWWAFIIYIAAAYLFYRGWLYIKLRINIIREKIFEMEVEKILKSGTYKKTRDNKSKALSRFSEENNLTRREEEILSHIIEGMSTNDIASLLRISPTTAKKHIQNLYEKTDTHSRIEIFTEFHKYIEKKL
jgi:DNA-binding CsgD family transcriptional regulator/ligand-binding sensor domain-containing protein